ncbi:MAG: hypothetical protein VKK59_07950 [Vampirovibrionales bacterium]|nr:hypothetical protein [Vampirovibrionales bacterium]
MPVHNISQFEAGVASGYARQAIRQFIKALTLKDPYRVQTFANTLAQGWFASCFGHAQAQRGKFNAAFSEDNFPTKASAFLNAALAFRRAIWTNPDALARYNAAVLSWMERFRFFRVHYFSTHCQKVPSQDVSLHFMFTAQVYELLHGRADLLARLLSDQPHGFHVQFCSQFSETFFDPGYVQINPITLWAETSRDRSPGVSHVFVHLLSQLETGAQTDVIFDMPAHTRQQLLRLKQAMSERFHHHDATRWGKLKALFSTDNHAGIHPYAFLPENPEFLTIAVEACQKSRHRLAKTELGRELLECLTHYFQWVSPEHF